VGRAAEQAWLAAEHGGRHWEGIKVRIQQGRLLLLLVFQKENQHSFFLFSSSFFTGKTRPSLSRWDYKQTDQDQVPETSNQVLTLTKQMCVSPSFHQLIFI
jgi:hypothetical protein